MPSSPGYKRNYAQEDATAKSRGDDKKNAERHKLRRKAVKLGMVTTGDGKDVDHRKPLSKGGANTIANARVRSEHANRSFPRRPDGSMIKNVPKK